MADEFKASSLDFGTLIAFVAPGFVVLNASGYHLPVVAQWTQSASTSSQDVGAFLFALLASLSMGLVVSGVRSLVIDSPLDRVLRSAGTVEPELPWNTMDANKLRKLMTLRDNYFRYYQFYSNMALAVVVWAVSRYLSRAPAIALWGWIVLFVVIVLLLFAAGAQLKDYYDAKTLLVAPADGIAVPIGARADKSS